MATLANPAAQAARNLALRFLLGIHAVRDKMAMTMSEIEIAYPDSGLSQGPGAGERLDPSDYAGPPPGSGPVPRFILYADDTARATRLASRFPNLLEVVPRLPPKPGTLLIVRPDAYIGFAGNDLAGAEAYLAQIA